MTREEEICIKARIYDLECATNSIVEAFIEGAEWADQHNAELEQLRKENQEQAAWIRKEIEHTQSPWISVEERLPARINDGIISETVLINLRNGKKVNRVVA